MDWIVPGKLVSVTDLPNYVDPMTCGDEFERVKFEFPFYRTELAVF